MSPACRVTFLVMIAASCACAPPESAREKQLDALQEIAERYRGRDGARASDSRPSDSEESRPPTADHDAAIAGMTDYQDARDAVGSGDMRRAIASLERATAINDECAEYWYNLGAAQANLAIQVVNEDEQEAVEHFRHSVDSKRRALDLMYAGKFQFYDEAAQQQVRFDAEQGLEGVEEVLADEASLIAALRMYAAAN